MRRMCAIVGAIIGSWIGWWLGAHVGLMSAFLLSMIGAAGGIYAGHRIARDYL